MKPLEFCNSFIVMRDTAYTLVNENGEGIGLSRTGVFKVGRVVWLPVLEKSNAPQTAHIVAWAEETGAVSISQNVLASTSDFGMLKWPSMPA